MRLALLALLLFAGCATGQGGDTVYVPVPVYHTPAYQPVPPQPVYAPPPIGVRPMPQYGTPPRR